MDNRSLSHLFENNRAWAASIQKQDPNFFHQLSQQQAPSCFWIGCSDSRVPANQLLGMLPGEVFVHRNVANLVVHTDLNCLSAMQFAVDVLKVRHIIVCGHFGCGGVLAALRGDRIGLCDNWIRHIQDVYEQHRDRFLNLADEQAAHDALCQLNVIEQVRNVCATTIAQDAWQRGQELVVHGWVYGISDGLLRDLNVTVANENEATSVHDAAVAALL
ncbi:MAG: carbonate dehydratase [Verrucomicrobiota bacterium]|nr:carbonate dehydratase [Verrucomicrobiota bacterium]